MSAVVTIGFVKDAKHHVDVQGFNVYHKNRLIKVSVSFGLYCLCSCQFSPYYYAFKSHDKVSTLCFRLLTFHFFCQPFWRIWNAAGSGGRGVIGIAINL